MINSGDTTSNWILERKWWWLCERVEGKADQRVERKTDKNEIKFLVFFILSIARERRGWYRAPLQLSEWSCSVVSDSLRPPWTVAYKAPLSMEFSRQEYWSGLPFPSPGDLPDPGIEPRSPTLQADALPSEPPGKSSLTVSGLEFYLKFKHLATQTHFLLFYVPVHYLKYCRYFPNVLFTAAFTSMFFRL